MTTPRSTRIVFIIRSYTVGAVVDHFDDGSFEAFDKAELDVVEGYRAGESLSVLLVPRNGDDVFWNRPGEQVEAWIDPKAVDGSDLLFAAAFKTEASTAS